jgi:hypothetical protein
MLQKDIPKRNQDGFLDVQYHSHCLPQFCFHHYPLLVLLRKRNGGKFCTRQHSGCSSHKNEIRPFSLKPSLLNESLIKSRYWEIAVSASGMAYKRGIVVIHSEISKSTEHRIKIKKWIFTFGSDDPCAGSPWRNGACCSSSSTLTVLGIEDCVASEGLVSEGAGAP